MATCILGWKRADRANLRPPRTLSSGTKVYEAALVYAGRPLQYGWGTETPTADALRDAQYLAGLRGAPLLIEHPPEETLEGGSPPEQGPGQVAGTVIAARFDEQEQAVIVEFAVHDQRDQRVVERWRQVSEGYLAATEGGRQVARESNHVAVVPEGRAPGNEVRADNKPGAEAMDPKIIEAMQAAIQRAVVAERERDEMKARADALQKRIDAAEAKEKEAEKAAESKMDESVAKTVKDSLSLMRQADSLGLELPEDMVQPEELAAFIAEQLGADPEKAKADAAYARAFVDGAMRARSASKDTAAPEEKMDRGDAATRMARGATHTRADSAWGNRYSF